MANAKATSSLDKFKALKEKNSWFPKSSGKVFLNRCLYKTGISIN